MGVREHGSGESASMGAREKGLHAAAAPVRRSPTPVLTHPSAHALSIALLGWYATDRRDLPWRSRRDPYRVLVSEFMLQQTQAERVAPRFEAFMQQFPTFAALASAPTADVLRAWSGLGYNRRALRLQAIARLVVTNHGAMLPREIAALRLLPGIGPYTAAAIACFAFGVQVPAVDTNVRRVLQRVVLGGETAGRRGERQTSEIAAKLLPVGQADDWNQALMDLGASICTARLPACDQCPLAALCRYRQGALRSAPAIGARVPAAARSAQPFVGSTRYYRGRVVRILTSLEAGEALPMAALGPQLKEGYASYDAGWLEGVLEGLEQDGLVALERGEGELRARLPEG
jgi:A/G-specific adenine glycosylase